MFHLPQHCDIIVLQSIKDKNENNSSLQVKDETIPRLPDSQKSKDLPRAPAGTPHTPTTPLASETTKRVIADSNDHGTTTPWEWWLYISDLFAVWW